MPQPSSRALLGEAGSFALQRPYVVPGHIGQCDNLRKFEPILARHTNVEPKPLGGEQRIRQAVLLSFCDPFPQQCLELPTLSRRQWQHLLRWLDLSGLALYFFDRLVELQLTHLLPAPVLTRLLENLQDNTERTHGMAAESIAIQQGFKDAGLRYAILKGLSLCPSSVPRPELRSQMDLDFLVAEEDLPQARDILAHRGYRLYESRKTCWEYKLNEKPGFALKDLYKNTGSWMVELHIEAGTFCRASALDCVEWREFYGFSMPVLSPIDLFLQQGLHAYKHICSQFCRAAFLVEFRRHALFRHDDDAFWDETLSAVNANPRALQALGVVTLLITRVMGEFAPEALTKRTLQSLSPAVRLWVELYGHRAALGSFPGSKLYLLLQTELEAAGAPMNRPLWQFLIPLRLPPAVIQAFPNETPYLRLARYRMRAGLLLSRLRFCTLAGLRFALELRRWRRHLNRIAQ